mmetsp:Transcript_139234/g.361881  ORF Transcript_139234/g.361881 Transcript_139234/m.361881 type:complete len:89 (-) Transcript_139234:2679-2945(-)
MCWAMCRWKQPTATTCSTFTKPASQLCGCSAFTSGDAIPRASGVSTRNLHTCEARHSSYIALQLANPCNGFQVWCWQNTQEFKHCRQT